MAKIVFTFLIIISILSYSHQDESATFQNCIGNGSCYLDIANPRCITLDRTSYKSIKESFNKTSYASSASISQVHCGTDSEKCLNQAPDEGIEVTCTKVPISDSEDASCCYMKVSYDKNKKYSCYPVKNDKDEIKALIEELKKEYIGSKKISIDCSTQNIALSFFGLFFVLFWL